MWVKIKEKTKLSAFTPDIEIMLSAQKGSKWIAFYEPDENSRLPWRLNHRHLNIRVSEEKFADLFEEVIFSD